MPFESDPNLDVPEPTDKSPVNVPPPTIVMTSSSIVATAVLELVYVNAPLLFDIGGVMLNGAFPAAFEGNEKSV